LGYTKDTCPILPDHDMEVIFDVHFNDEDLTAVSCRSHLLCILLLCYFDPLFIHKEVILVILAYLKVKISRVFNFTIFAILVKNGELNPREISCL